MNRKFNGAIFAIVNDYVILDNELNPSINPEYFRADNKYARAFRYGQGGNNTGMMELNYWGKDLPDIPPDGVDIPEIEYCNTCYLNIPIKFALGEDGVPLPEAETENLGRWSFIQVDNGEYLFSSQQFHFPENINMVMETGDQNMYAVTTRSLGATAEHELRFNTSASGADWNKIGVISNWDSSIQSTKAGVEKDGTLFSIVVSNDALKLAEIGTPGAGQIALNNDFCETTYPLFTFSEYDVPELTEDSIP